MQCFLLFLESVGRIAVYIRCIQTSYVYRPNSQTPQFTHPISHSAPFRTDVCAFLFWMAHCGICDRCIVGFMRSANWSGITQIIALHDNDNIKTLSPHYGDVIMSAMASQITSLTIVYSSVSLGADKKKHQNSASLAFVWGIRRRPVNSPHKGQ